MLTCFYYRKSAPLVCCVWQLSKIFAATILNTRTAYTREPRKKKPTHDLQWRFGTIQVSVKYPPTPPTNLTPTLTVNLIQGRGGWTISQKPGLISTFNRNFIPLHILENNCHQTREFLANPISKLHIPFIRVG